MTAEPRRLLLAGDTHGNGRWCSVLSAIARRHQCDAVVQLGDFGFWPHQEWGRQFFKHVSELAAAGPPWYWLDGNHENHDMLQALLETRPDASSASSPVEIAAGLHYLPRGCRWEWSGVRLGALGGAASIDADWRTEGVSWWRSEEPTVGDLLRLGDGQLDVLLCHDSPIVPPDLVDHVKDDHPPSRGVRQLLVQAVENTRPHLLIHGHWHHQYNGRYDDTTVVGLASDQQHNDGSWLVLDLTTLLP